MEKYEEARIEICRYFFGDDRLNVVRNLKLVYDAYVSNQSFDKQKYKLLIDFYNKLSSKKEHLIRSLNSYNGQDVQSLLYDAIKDIQTSAFEDIKSGCYELSDEDVDAELSSKSGVKIYNIHKLPKRMLVSVTTWNKHTNSNYVEGTSTRNDDNFFNHIRAKRAHKKSYQDYKSLSLISNEQIKTYRDLQDYVCLVYSPDIPNERLITINTDDAWVKFVGRDRIISSKKPFYGSAERLLENTRYYNEIAVLRSDNYIEDEIDEHELKPIGIFCVGTVSSVEIELAKQFDLPIIFSESSYKYVQPPQQKIDKDYYSFE